jgi:nitroimidazol reductase NimA-like FMN-containing flavoprotein (pyridoxamine 5'-phosphate oxidase superfamily)
MTPQVSRTTVRRLSDKAVDDFDVVRRILSDGVVAHVGIVAKEGHPVVIPMAYAFVDDALLLHGSVASRLMRSGTEVCATVTLLDGIVVARSLFASSMNYRSVMIFGHPEIVTDDEKEQALLALSEALIPGRVGHARGPSRTELRETMVWRLPVNEWSAKVRTGPPVEASADDLELDYWGGEIPLRVVATEAQSDGQGRDVPVPEHIRKIIRERS